MPDVTPEATPGRLAAEVWHAHRFNAGKTLWMDETYGRAAETWDAVAAAVLALPCAAAENELIAQLSLDMDEIASLNARLRQAEAERDRQARYAASGYVEADLLRRQRDAYRELLNEAGIADVTPAEWPPEWEQAAASSLAERDRYRAALERDRYRAALERIRDHEPSLPGGLARQFARDALAGDAPRHVPDDDSYPDAEEMASLDDLEPLPGIGERMAEAWRQGLEGTGG